MHKKIITTRVLNYGTLADWRWLRSVYGLTGLRETLEAETPFGRDAIRIQSRRLASRILT